MISDQNREDDDRKHEEQAPAAICGQGTPLVLPCRPAKYTGTVTACALLSVMAKPNSFQAEMRQNTAVTAMPVRAWGNMIRKNAEAREYPSTSADSS